MGNRRFRNSIGVGRGRHKPQWNQAPMNVNIEEDDGVIYVTIPYDEDAKEALKERFHAKWDPTEKYWMILASDYGIQEVEAELKLHFPRAFR